MSGRGPDKGPPVAQLVCPGCDATADADARFCPECGLPLIYGPDATAAGSLEPVSDARRRAWLVKPQLAEGRLTKVAWANKDRKSVV